MHRIFRFTLPGHSAVFSVSCSRLYQSVRPAPRQSEEPGQGRETCCEIMMISIRVIPSALIPLITLLHLLTVTAAIKCFTCNEEANITCPGWDRSDQFSHSDLSEKLKLGRKPTKHYFETPILS